MYVPTSTYLIYGNSFLLICDKYASLISIIKDKLYRYIFIYHAYLYQNPHM